MASITRAPATEADLLRMPKDGRKYELVDGRIRMSPAGTLHGKVCVKLVVRLGSFVEDRHLGHVFDSSTGSRSGSSRGGWPWSWIVSTGAVAGF